MNTLDIITKIYDRYTYDHILILVNQDELLFTLDLQEKNTYINLLQKIKDRYVSYTYLKTNNQNKYDIITSYGNIFYTIYLVYQEFLDLIKTDVILDNLTYHDKRLYYEFILKMSVFSIHNIKIDGKNKYNIKYVDIDIISPCYILYHKIDDLSKFEDYIRLFYQELKVDIYPSIYFVLNLHKKEGNRVSRSKI